MNTVALGWVDYFVLALYVAFVVGIGWVLKEYMKTSSDFLTARGSIPAWVTGLAFMSANLGALELVGMAASGAKYGIATAHFYWVGAIPAMVFLAVFMMPFYYGSKARSVPEYLKLRFDERTRALNSITFAVMTVFASGISMNALAKLLNQLLGWNYHAALWVCSVVVLVYVLRGGLTSAIYTEVLQFFMIVLGFAPVVWLALQDVGGWGKMNEALATVATNPAATRRQRQGLRPRRVVERLDAPPRRPCREPDGRRPLRHGLRPRLRAVVRLLVHELPRRPARHGGEEHERGPPHAAHRRGAQDAHPRARHPARDAGRLPRVARQGRLPASRRSRSRATAASSRW